MQYSANQAAEVTGKNVATITRAIKSGKLSATKDASGAWQIDGAELSRVFPLRAQSLHGLTMQKDATPTQRELSSDDSALREELAALRERVKAQDVLIEKERETSAREREVSADLREERDKWRQQATNLLANQAAAKEAKPEFEPIPPRPWVWRLLRRKG